MAPTGFEPATPGLLHEVFRDADETCFSLKVQCSSQAELRSHNIFIIE